MYSAASRGSGAPRHKPRSLTPHRTARSRHQRLGALLLTNKIATASRPHARGVYSSSGDVAAITDAIGVRFPTHCEGHLAIEDDVRRQRCVRVVRIVRGRPILPDIGVRKAL